MGGSPGVRKGVIEMAKAASKTAAKGAKKKHGLKGRPSNNPKGNPESVKKANEASRKARLAPVVEEPRDETLGRQECVDWLEQRGHTEHRRESLVVRADMEPPDDPVMLVRFRLAVWDRGSFGNPKGKEFVTAVLARCTGSGLTDVNALVYFTKVFVWQNNPALKGKEVGPFIPWPYQVEGAREILETLLAPSENWEREDLGVEKSRELGATWWILIIAVWIAACHKNKRVLALSHTEEAVAKAGDEDTLFGKVEFMQRRMPEWFIRGAYKRRKVFRYPGTGSQISGVASTSRSGVGGRVTLVILDELSKQRDADAIWSQTASTGNRLFVGTHYGVANKFFELTQGPHPVRKIVWHWTQHPTFGRGKYRSTEGGHEVIDKDYEFPNQCPKCSRVQKLMVGELTRCCRQPTRAFKFVEGGKPHGGPHPGIRSPWYDRECVRRKSEREVAMHLDIDPKASVSQVFDAFTIYRLIERAKDRRHVWQGDLRDGKLVMDASGPLKLWVMPDYHGNFPPGRYGAGADVSEGVGATPSCLAVMDAGLACRVAEYANAFIDPKPFAEFCVALCSLFKTNSGRGALLCWESQGPGSRFGKRVIELNYSMVYGVVDEQPRTGFVEASERKGWNATDENIHFSITEYKHAVQTGVLAEYSLETLQETLSYQYGKTGRPEHPNKKRNPDPSGAGVAHGDFVTAAHLAWKMCCELGTGRSILERSPEMTVVGSWAWRRQEAERQDREREEWE